MGYPDALGHFLNNEKMQEIGFDVDIIKDLEEKIISVPFRQSSLNGIIKGHLKTHQDHYIFLNQYQI